MGQLRRIYEKLKKQHEINGWEINESRLQQQSWMLNDRIIFESNSLSPVSSSSAAGGGRRAVETYEEWITIFDTVWIYPTNDVNLVIEIYKGLSPSLIQNGNDLIFTDINHLYSFYDATFTQTISPELTQGYNLGVGTKLKDLKQTLNLISSETGYTVIKWGLFEQLTDQDDLPSGGDSPKNTIGYVAIYTDWLQTGTQDLPYDPSDPGYAAVSPPSLGFSNGDPLRVEKTGFLI
jgi:hypothetical protein